MLTDINQQILTSKSSRENKSGKYTTKYNPMKIELKTMIFLFALINLTDFFLNTNFGGEDLSRYIPLWL